MSRFLSKDTNVFVTLLVLTRPLVQSQNVFMKYYWRSNSYRATGWIGTGEGKRDTGLKPGETQTKCLSRLKPGVPIHHHCPNPPHLMVNISWSVVFKRFLLYSCSSRRKTQANLVIWGVFLPILEPLEGPPSSTLGNLIFLDTLYR